MIGPIGAIRVQRSAPSARVARKASASADVVAFDATEAPARRPTRQEEAEPDDAGSLDRSRRKVSPAVLAALLKLKRGG